LISYSRKPSTITVLYNLKYTCFLGNGEKALAIPDDVLESLKSSCDPKDIVCKLNESLQLNEAAMEQPDAETKRLIRYLVRQAKSSRRLDVVKHLRKILPAGTTG